VASLDLVGSVEGDSFASLGVALGTSGFVVGVHVPQRGGSGSRLGGVTSSLLECSGGVLLGSDERHATGRAQGGIEALGTLAALASAGVIKAVVVSTLLAGSAVFANVAGAAAALGGRADLGGKASSLVAVGVRGGLPVAQDLALGPFAVSGLAFGVRPSNAESVASVWGFVSVLAGRAVGHAELNAAGTSAYVFAARAVGAVNTDLEASTGLV